jgi:hypothetical protein
VTRFWKILPMIPFPLSQTFWRTRVQLQQVSAARMLCLFAEREQRQGAQVKPAKLKAKPSSLNTPDAKFKP